MKDQSVLLPILHAKGLRAAPRAAAPYRRANYPPTVAYRRFDAYGTLIAAAAIFDDRYRVAGNRPHQLTARAPIRDWSRIRNARAKDPAGGPHPAQNPTSPASFRPRGERDRHLRSRSGARDRQTNDFAVDPVSAARMMACHGLLIHSASVDPRAIDNGSNSPLPDRWPGDGSSGSELCVT
jgi:hypothetical protein